VVLTDIKTNLPLLNEIKAINNINDDRLLIEKLHWENKADIDAIKTKYDQFDIIIGSELVYSEEYLNDLSNTLKEFSNENTKVILSFKIRLPELTQSFLDMFTVHFNYEYVDEKLYRSFYPNQKLKIIIATLKP
jgi:histidinol phosphatase-like PHP family hydrolase